MSAESSRSLRGVLICFSAALVGSNAGAQFNNPWAAFVKDPNRIRNPDGSVATQVTTDTQEKDYAWGDLDHDGWIDLVVVRNGLATGNFKLPNQLLMNEGGLLVDRTSVFVTDSSVPGDAGFLTPTCDRDVQVVDVNGDGWLDVVTAVTLSDADPKHVSHPRVYVNKGALAGVWQGLRYEEARIPQLLTIFAGTAVAPRFNSVSVGDVSGDGFPDLYFTDHDHFMTTEAQGADLNDRLLINDGLGGFVDSFETRLPWWFLDSYYGMASLLSDVNGDGAVDVLKMTAGTQSHVLLKLAYNSPAAIGTFTQFVPNVFTTSQVPYHFDLGDLNRDGKQDLLVTSDFLDFVRFNLGNDTTGNVIWGPLRYYQFLSESDDGFGGNIRIADLDGDSWPETIHADIDTQIWNCPRRCHIYHNLGGAIGSEVVLREEAEMSGAAGWKGAVGLDPAELTGTFDVATFDIDNDGDIDLVFGRCSGTTVWINQAAQPGSFSCVGDGTGVQCPCGNLSPVGANAGCLSSTALAGKLRPVGFAYATADSLSLVATGVPDNAGLFVQGSSATSGSTFGDGLLCTRGAIIRLGVVFASGNTSSYPRPGLDPALSVQGLVAAGDVRTYQLWYRDSDLSFCTSATFNLTNALTLTWQN